MVERSHEIEQIYMQQLKNIESAIYVLRTKKNSYEKSLRDLRMPISDPVNPEKPDKNQSYIKIALGWGFLSAIGMCFFLWCMIYINKIGYDFWGRKYYKNSADWISEHIVFVTIVTFIVVVFVLFIIFFKKCTNENKEKEEKYRKTIEMNKRRSDENELKRKQNASLAKQREQQLAKIIEELQRALTVRESLYSVNWIPVNYRNIRVAYYISDMVMSSAITVEEALKYYLLQEVNNKLDEVLRKLDEIIANQNQIIVNQAIVESQNNELISQNENVIRRIAKTEENTQIAAEYAQVAVNYAEANAYFSWATYLKK